MVDGDFVVYRGEVVGLSYAMRDERGVVYAFWEIALVAGEEKYMVEIEVTGFEDTHNLNTFYGFTVKGDCGG